MNRFVRLLVCSFHICTWFYVISFALYVLLRRADVHACICGRAFEQSACARTNLPAHVLVCVRVCLCAFVRACMDGN